jgi:hypothetical protein
MPALLTQMSMVPSSSTVRDANATMDSSSATSRPPPVTCMPRAERASAEATASFSSRSPIITAAPASASLVAAARPMPFAPPVTTATRPDSETRSAMLRSLTSAMAMVFSSWIPPAAVDAWWAAWRLVPVRRRC